MLNALMRSYQLVMPIGGAEGDVRNAEIIRDIRAYVTPIFRDRRVTLRRNTGFDYAGVTHCGLTTDSAAARGMYLRRGKRLWRVDYAADSVRGERILYLFELP